MNEHALNPKVNICIATYNGAKYLIEQLDSIKYQTYQNWECLIRDDGSTDGTIDLIKDYCEKNSKFEFINCGQIENLGSHRSFFELVKYKKADYYFFCDQDDIWKKNKIELFLSKTNFETEKPELVYSGWTTVDENLNLLKEVFPKTTINEQISFNQINGMSMMLNDKLVKIWNYRKWGAHDSFVALIAYTIGNVIYIPKSTILWRRLSSSESISNYGRGFGIETFWKMMEMSFVRSQLVLDDYEKYMDKYHKGFLKSFVSIPKMNFFNRLKTLMELKLRRKSLIETIALNFLLLFKYKMPKNILQELLNKEKI
ncbi:glycosyl transferase family 2 [Streptococcus bovimastitidis]|uniref:Glycosyl transferase family 2 n=1 Tax=Streptococcus bovimastitidis TaxID=1856638 RepID=A0A1L8MPH4_9STRE|nr:glycosyltransferase family 2 protein [Streptococcus bovimastitidis]OJF72658.1 glycosyl transferase family 2 [Streptococcus bovimastitidis]